MNIRRAVLAAVGAALLVVPLSATAAHAAWPGRDGRIAFVRAGDIYTIKPNGAALRRLTFDGENSGPRWGPGGRRIAYVHAGQLWIMKANGAGKTQASTLTDVHRPAFSPDGRYLATATGEQFGGGSFGLYRITIATGETEQFVDPALGDIVRAHSSAVSWSVDGVNILFEGGECEAIDDNCLSRLALENADSLSGRETGEKAYGGFYGSGRAWSPDWRPDGEGYVFTEYRCPLGVACTPDEAERRRHVTLPDETEIPHAYFGVNAPSGTRVAYVKDIRGTPRIFLARSDGRGAHRLVRGTEPDWQPKGRTVR